MVSSILSGALALAAIATVQTPQQSYFDWTDLPFPADEYVSRRARMIATMRDAGHDLFLAPSGQGISHGNTFRPLNDFNYYTGLEVPDAVLVLDGTNGQATVFVSSRDPRFESPSRPNDFPGRPLADDPQIARRTGLAIAPIEQFGGFLRDAEANGSSIGLNIGRRGAIGAVELSPNLSWSPEDGLAVWLRSVVEADPKNLFEQVAAVRMIKSDREIALMREVAQVTVNAISHAAAFVKPGVDERTLEGELEASYKRQGAQRPAFASIIKSGPNSLWPWRILASHYNRRNRVMEAGDLVIFDVGAELDYYVSDIGRTFPVSGTFTPRQREILAMEIGVSDAIIEAVRPGVTLADLQRVADSAIPAEHKPFMQTGLFFGHHLGLDTGEPTLAEVPLQPGMIFTVEPWYYNHVEGISVFTEDEVLVTTTGAEVLSGSLPRRPYDLERLVRGGR